MSRCAVLSASLGGLLGAAGGVAAVGVVAEAACARVGAPNPRERRTAMTTETEETFMGVGLLGPDFPRALKVSARSPSDLRRNVGAAPCVADRAARKPLSRLI